MSEVARAVDERVAHEARDAAWSGPVEAAIATAFGAEALRGSSLLRATCGSTACRADVAHDDADSQDRFLRLLAARRVPVFADGEGFALRGSDGSRTAVYLARAGHPLLR